MNITKVAYHLNEMEHNNSRICIHNDIELIQIRSGSGMVLMGGKSYNLRGQTLYIIDGRTPHIINLNKSEPYVRNKLLINADSLFKYCRELELESVLEELLNAPPISTEESPEIERLFLTIYNLYESDVPENRGFAHGYILQLLHRAHTLSKESSKTESANPIIKKMLKQVKMKDGVVSLSEISEALHMDKYYLCHFFKEKTGITLSDWIANYRSQKATGLLTDTTQTIEAIALLCGFSSAPAFIRFFKNQIGITPHEYRKRNRKN